MFGQQIVGSLDRFLRIILQVAWLNFLWIGFTLVGLVVGGIFPATTAAIAVARKWVQKKEEVPIFKTFKQAYKREFIKSNIIGIILAVVGIMLVVNYQILLQLGDQISIIAVFLYYFVIFLYGILVLWIFPLLTHYNSSVFQYFKNAIIIGITKLPITILQGLIIFFILYFSLKLPSMLIFCTISLITITVAFFSVKVFEKIDTSE
ncbi:YesL family protein [Gracilibacillus massiliensis]|uniref:YesL family protein n=1 Tax=Gracilibacillus massiliensis TaxID=1564956 RepID=UPI00071D1F84|nr:YesL family protein [Gracilibacillus massiliensis]